MQQPFSGAGVALVTPFKNHEIDYPALKRIINFVIEGGVDFIVSLGTTGEAVTLTAQECREVLDFTLQETNNRVPIVAGFFGSNFTERLVANLRQYDFTGVAAVMSSSPAYTKPSQEGIFRHYMAVADASPLPVIIYNVPSRTGSNVLPETILRLAQTSPKFMAVKEASGNLDQAMKILKYRPDHLQVFCGDDPLTLPMIAGGGHGAISVIANVYPAQFSNLVKAAREGNFDLARKLNFDLLDVHPWLYIEGNPVGIKAAMEIAGHCSREVRIPLVEQSETNYRKLQEAMAMVSAWDFAG